MRRKNVLEDTGYRTASESRIHADFFGQRGNKDTGFTENIPFFGREMPDRRYRFCKRTRDDHMRNAQLKPGYNVQIAVDSEYIVAADLFQDRNDVWTLVPF